VQVRTKGDMSLSYISQRSPSNVFFVGGLDVYGRPKIPPRGWVREDGHGVLPEFRARGTAYRGGVSCKRSETGGLGKDGAGSSLL
jgi:hypothetical protein